MASKPAYQTEPDAEFSRAIWDRGHLTPLEFFRVAAWKSAKGLASLSLNSEQEFTTATAAMLDSLSVFKSSDACSDTIDWDAWQEVAATTIGSKRERTGLLGLQGVGYPMATAVACIMLPKVFPVMDRWAITLLTNKSFGESARWHRSVVYRQYSELLAGSASTIFKDARTIHDRDIIIMGLGMNGRPRPRDLPTLDIPTPER